MLKNFFLYGFTLAFLQLLIACGPAPEDEQAVLKDVETAAPKADGDRAAEAKEAEILIVAFGDSLYAGYGLDQKEGFAPELQAALTAAGKDVRVHNAGVSGDTTAAGLRRMDFVLDSLSRKPDLVILGLGGNDLLRGLKPADTRANMEAMVKKLQDRDIPVMLTGMLAPPNLGAAFSDEFNIIYPALAKKYDVALYPFFMDGVVGHPDLFLPDGLHPTAEGIDIIVGKIAPQVAELLEG
ncbi:arylesterase [uncultured Parasphingorhabdus sp.]|uniref:arylesterase n=1 Tax=uncultured Parasphingorhabdus sp. TaxID=2709694 RepID=UPI0030D9D685|tara:strand:+ start:20135 stop:20851 length:717 start_codon:yes stop_codon:yes gene_type:complete